MLTILLAAAWIAYPGDYGIWWGNEVQANRLQHGGNELVTWPQYEPHSRVIFSKELKLEKPETVRIYADGRFRVGCTAFKPDWTYSAPTNAYVIPAGTSKLSVKVYNPARPPAILVEGANVFTGSGWTACWDFAEEVPAETLGEFDDPQTPPGLAALPTRRERAVATRRIGRDVLVDFGRETYGFVVLKDVKSGGRMKVVYAESEVEALDGGDLTCDSWEIVDVAAGREFRLPYPRGFRFVRISPLEKGLEIGPVEMDYQWKGLPRRGSFACDDKLLNRIWEVGAYTLELTSREVFIEGVKRDHWVWSGDLAQSLLMNYYLYADYPGAKNSLWCVRGKDPVRRHLNRIMDYTFYWFDEVWQYYLFSGDRDFLGQVYPRMKTMMDYCIGRLDARGYPVDRPDDWMFVDWAPERLHNNGGILSFMMILFSRACESMASVAEVLGVTADAAAFRARAAKLRRDVKPLFWCEERGGLGHLLKDDGTIDDQFTRYPNIFGLFYGYFSDAEKERVVRDVLLNDRVMRIQTPYMRFYELEALCRIGRQREVLDEIRSYWGGMLNLGATSFWELYNPEEKGLQHYAMYGRPFGKSLCHAWGASPVYLLGRYFLGVEPTEPGFAKYVVRPNAGGLSWMEGTVPTPRGDIRVRVDGGKVRVTGNGGTGVLHWKGREFEIAPGKTMEAK